VSLTVVIPTFNSAEFIERTVLSVCDCLVGFGLREINVVNDASTDNTVSVLKNIQGVPSQVNLRVFSMSINVGQTNATAVGLSHSTSKFVLTLDDDLKDDLVSVESLLSTIKSTNSDFVVGAPDSPVNGRFRSIATEIIRRIAVRLYETPEHFRFSSFCIYTREFLKRSQIERQEHFEIGWMFLLTKNYSNASTRSQTGLRALSNFNFWLLVKSSMPFLRYIAQRQLRILGALSGTLTAISVFLVFTFAIRFVSTGTVLPGFASLYLLSLLNLGILGVIGQRILSLSVQKSSFLDIRRVVMELK
jgi:glycosyltransferase involved in cell wall biosynthesis